MKSIKTIKDNNIVSPIIKAQGLTQSIGHNTESLNYAKRMQKITHALYLITNTSEVRNTLANIVCEDSAHATQMLFSLVSGHDDNVLLNVQAKLLAVHSYLEILVENDFISEMNYCVVSGEVQKLHDKLSSTIRKGLVHKKNIHIDTAFFLDDEAPAESDAYLYEKESTTSVAFSDQHVLPVHTKTSSPAKAPDKNRETATQQGKGVEKKRTQQRAPLESKMSLKEKRQNNIINILKQKKDASIKDICSLFKDCSSKTIQRDLVELIDMKKVVKRGERRWSTYNLK